MLRAGLAGAVVRVRARGRGAAGDAPAATDAHADLPAAAVASPARPIRAEPHPTPCLRWCAASGPAPSSVVVNTQGRESGGSGFETCSGVWYPRRRPRGVAVNTLVDLINWL